MRLLTLGGLALANRSFGRVKPLLLLAYLALEGPQERRHLARLFWPGASDALNSLSAALTRLRKSVGGAVEGDELRVWVNVEVDVGDLLSALASGDLERALELYRGPFLHGTFLPDWSPELEEWVYATRESLAERVQRALLTLAERGAAQGHFAGAAKRAETAYALAGAPPCEPEVLTRLYLILQAGESPVAARVSGEAEMFELGLNVSCDAARTSLQRMLVGRSRETVRLKQLQPGEWAWVRGGAGMGKTALLKSLPGTFLYGRSGLPYATLEPLSGKTEALAEGETAILQRLLCAQGGWLIDNWNRVDAPSQKLLTRLRDLRPQVSVIITSRDPPPFAVDMQLELSPIAESELAPEIWEQTQGLPALVEASLRSEPLEAALEARLAAHTPEARDVYLALALLDTPDLALVRRALGFGAAVTARVLAELLAAGLVEPSGQVRVRQAAQAYLETRPTLLGPLSLSLSRVLGDLEAFPLYEYSRHLWAPEDEPKVVRAYLAWADELLRRGFPQRAFETLAHAPQVQAVAFLRARALERAGRYQEAFESLRTLTETPETLALTSMLHYRLGKPVAAKEAAQRALEKTDSLATRATALNTLGNLARSAASYEEAIRLFRKAAALWQAQGDRMRWADALSNLGVCQGEQGEAPEQAEKTFLEVLETAAENPMLRARILNNLGHLVYEPQKRFGEAKKTYRACIKLHEEFGLLDTATGAWLNLGVIYHLQGQPENAKNAYEQTIELAQRAGDKQALGHALANLAELSENSEYWEEALRILRHAGYSADIARLYGGLSENHPFRARSEQNG